MGPLPSPCEAVLIVAALIGFAVMIAYGASTLFWGVKTLFSTDYMTVLTHLIVGWIGATIGLMIGSKEDNS
jgi:hypothetical protein